MAIVAFTAWKVTCSFCGADMSGDGGETWYRSFEDATDDIDAWGWHWEGKAHACCPECHDPCLDCDRIHGSHAIDCDVACVDTVDDWVALLTAEGGEA